MIRRIILGFSIFILIVSSLQIVRLLPPQMSVKSLKRDTVGIKLQRKQKKDGKYQLYVSMAIIKQESSFIADARPWKNKAFRLHSLKRVTSARGYAQAVDGTWEMYLKDRGLVC